MSKTLSNDSMPDLPTQQPKNVEGTGGRSGLSPQLHTSSPVGFVPPPPPPPLPSTLQNTRVPSLGNEGSATSSARQDSGPFSSTRSPTPTASHNSRAASRQGVSSLSQSYSPFTASAATGSYSLGSDWRPLPYESYPTQSSATGPSSAVTSGSEIQAPSYTTYPPTYSQPSQSRSTPYASSATNLNQSASGLYQTSSTPYQSASSPYASATTAYQPGPRPARKKTDAYVAADPFHSTNNTKTDKISDDLTFDDIPTAGVKPTTPHGPGTPYGSSVTPSQSIKPVSSQSGQYSMSGPSPTPAPSYGYPSSVVDGRTPSSSSSYPYSQQQSVPSPYAPSTASQSRPQTAVSTPVYNTQPSPAAPISAPSNPYTPSTTGPTKFSYNGPTRSDSLEAPIVAGPQYQQPPTLPGTIPFSQAPASPSNPTPAPSYTYHSPYDGRVDTAPATNTSQYTPSPYASNEAPFPVQSSPWQSLPPPPLSPIYEDTPYRQVVRPIASIYDTIYSLNPDLYTESTTKLALRFVGSTLPRQVYLHLLLRMPALYFGRVARIFEEADLTLPELKKMALETATEGKFDLLIMESSSVPPQYERLKNTWEGFIDSVMREWKTFNIISVLLLSAILTILQIDAAAADPVTRYTALFSLICALMSLLFGCMYIIRFGTMRKTYKAAEWALEAKRTKTLIWWNVWVLLAMPVIWLTWSILLYIVCIMSFIWRTSSLDTGPPPQLSHGGLLAIRIVLTVVLGLGVVYASLILITFRRYGEAMDRQWKERIDGWLEQKSVYAPPDSYSNPYSNLYPGQSLVGYNGNPEPHTSPYPYPTPPSGPPPSSLQRVPSYADYSYGYGYTADVKTSAGEPGAPAYSAAPLVDADRPGTPDSPDSTTRLTQSNTYYNKAAGKLSENSYGRHSSLLEDSGLPPPTNPPPPPPTYGSLKTAPKLAVPPPETLPTIPPTPPTPLAPLRRTPTSSVEAPNDDDASDEDSPHVHFRSPLASAHTGSTSPWSYSTSTPGRLPAEAGPSNSSSSVDLSRRASAVSTGSFNPYRLYEPSRDSQE